jgi:hypothetical protein
MDGWMDEKRIMDGRGIEKIMDGWMKNGLWMDEGYKKKNYG